MLQSKMIKRLPNSYKQCITTSNDFKQIIIQTANTFESYLKLQPNLPTNYKSNGLFQDIIYQDKGHYWGTVKVNHQGLSRHGFGRYDYNNGGVYDGQWNEDSMSGYGQLYYPGGLLAYEGEWIMNQFHGLGVQYNNTIQYGAVSYLDFSTIGENWSRYEGQMQSDKRNGFGKLILSDGSFYQGAFQDDIPNGQGLVYQKNKVQSATWTKGKAQILIEISIE